MTLFAASRTFPWLQYTHLKWKAVRTARFSDCAVAVHAALTWAVAWRTQFTLLVLMDAAAVAEGLKDFTSSAPAAEILAEALALEVFNHKGERIALSELACDSKQTSVVVFGRNLL
jgi:hypothetical protein